jgi:predicted RNA-binding protein associated with RNAse of E/G family
VRSSTEVRIHYHRPPDRTDVFRQRLIERSPACLVTFLERTPLPAAVVVDGTIVLEQGSPVIWFTFPGRWHDVGLFHTLAGEFTGTYANILTPVRFLDERTWETTDLFLDVWVDAAGRPSLLDGDELEDALAAGSISATLAAEARAEAGRILESIAAGDWPPAPVADWSLARVRARLTDPA